jgi:polyhydroxyalkanoate synthesis repressor PhaR
MKSVRRITKYPNRRLYDTGISQYVKYPDIVQLMRQGEELQIVEKRAGRDITREVLLQVLVHVEEDRQVPALSIPTLTRLITRGGNP